MSIDWTELERLHKVSSDKEESDKVRWIADQELKYTLMENMPAILAERKAMLAKLEAAQRLRHEVETFNNNTGHQRLTAALAAFDKEQTA